MEKNEFKIENKHIFSLASIMFFAPIIHFLLQSGDFELSEKDKKFINGYIKYGFLIVALAITSFILFMVNLYITNSAFNIANISYIIQILGYILIISCIILIIIGIFFIFSDKSIFQDNIKIDYKKINAGNTSILFCFIPIYNLYLRYTSENVKTKWWLKESILFWSIRTVVTLISEGSLFSTILLILIIFRISTLIGGIDLIKDNYKEKINTLFGTNPEEIFGYIKGPINFIIKNIQNNQTDIINEIQKSKNEYKKLTTISFSFSKQNIKENKILFLQYILFFIFAIYFFSIIYNYIYYNLDGNIFMFALLLWVGRYIIMIYLRKLPFVPVFNEIGYYIIRLARFFTKNI